MSDSVQIQAYEIDGTPIGPVNITWDEDDKRSHMYVNLYKVRATSRKPPWMVIDVTWIDGNGRPHQSLKVNEAEFQRLTNPRDDDDK
jgi:hypothetical protein